MGVTVAESMKRRRDPRTVMTGLSALPPPCHSPGAWGDGLWQHVPQGLLLSFSLDSFIFSGRLFSAMTLSLYRRDDGRHGESIQEPLSQRVTLYIVHMYVRRTQNSVRLKRSFSQKLLSATDLLSSWALVDYCNTHTI